MADLSDKVAPGEALNPSNLRCKDNFLTPIIHAKPRTIACIGFLVGFVIGINITKNKYEQLIAGGIPTPPPIDWLTEATK